MEAVAKLFRHVAWLAKVKRNSIFGYYVDVSRVLKRLFGWEGWS